MTDLPDLDKLTYTAENCPGGPGIIHGPDCRHSQPLVRWSTADPAVGSSVRRTYAIVDRRLTVSDGTRVVYSALVADDVAGRAEAERYELQEQETDR